MTHRGTRRGLQETVYWTESSVDARVRPPKDSICFSALGFVWVGWLREASYLRRLSRASMYLGYPVAELRLVQS